MWELCNKDVLTLFRDQVLWLYAFLERVLSGWPIG
jgi:hypothetical protein